MELYILISLHNYFIMYDIKFFFLNKINQTIQAGAKKNWREQITEIIIEKHYFLKSRGAPAPLAHAASISDSIECQTDPNE
jgi:hypothetical protein